jgi:hypothetical protein
MTAQLQTSTGAVTQFFSEIASLRRNFADRTLPLALGVAAQVEALLDCIGELPAPARRAWHERFRKQVLHNNGVEGLSLVVTTWNDEPGPKSTREIIRCVIGVAQAPAQEAIEQYLLGTGPGWSLASAEFAMPGQIAMFVASGGDGAGEVGTEPTIAVSIDASGVTLGRLREALDQYRCAGHAGHTLSIKLLMAAAG